MSVFPINFLKYFSLKKDVSQRMINLRDISSLNRPRFTPFVAIARIDSTSTMISITMSVIAIVGVMPVYISSR
jgi:hypothetical protein